MAFPRIAALAEVAWTPLRLRNYQNFAARLDGQASKPRRALAGTTGRNSHSTDVRIPSSGRTAR